MKMEQPDVELENRRAELREALSRIETATQEANRLRSEVNTVMQDVANAKRQRAQLRSREHQAALAFKAAGFAIDFERYFTPKGVEQSRGAVYAPGVDEALFNYFPLNGLVEPTYEAAINGQTVDQAVAIAKAMTQGGFVTRRGIIDAIESGLAAIDAAGAGQTGGAKALRDALAKLRAVRKAEPLRV